MSEPLLTPNVSFKDPGFRLDHPRHPLCLPGVWVTDIESCGGVREETQGRRSPEANGTMLRDSVCTILDSRLRESRLLVSFPRPTGVNPYGPRLPETGVRFVLDVCPCHLLPTVPVTSLVDFVVKSPDSLRN